MTSRYENVSGQWVTFSQTWTKDNRVETINGNGQSVTYTYDGDGNRVKKVQNGQTTIYIGAIYEKNLSTSEVTTYYFAGSQRVAMRNSSGLYYFVADHLGSTSVTLDASGNKIGEMKYYPFGETRPGYPNPSNGVPTDRRFTGQRQEDSSLGSLYDFNARFFSPALGRFLSADTIVPQAGNPQTLNRYSYAYNNPLNYTDPSGHMPTDGCSTEGCELRSADLYSFRRAPWDQLTTQEQEVLIKAIGGDAQAAQRNWTAEYSGNAVNVAGRFPEDPATYIPIGGGIVGGVKLAQLGWSLLKELGSSIVTACVASEPCREKVEDAGQLIKELRELGVKFTPENLVRATKLASGQIVFLEEGNVASGLQHILEGHAVDFANRGITASQIPNALFTALNEGTVIGTQGGASIYQFTFSGQLQNVAIVIGSNGYIVTAYPVTP